MSKKKKHHRSKAGQKRKAACKDNRLRNGDKIQVNHAEATEVHNYPKLNEVAHCFRASELGSNDEPGAMAYSVVAYVASLRSRLLNGEDVKPNVFLQMGYSYLSLSQWGKRAQMHAGGGSNISVMQLALLDAEHLANLIRALEKNCRENIALINENNVRNIRTVIVRVDETEVEREPLSAFDIPSELIDQDGYIESKIEYEING